ncbi:hypothetical protein EYF80_015558 [Liparis tanakae]|uniref:Uncharacterized protein n=1 Tax=Liparis tanakae TaxID=230148 RepID=A0A4Z2IA90_9TELE|nr:hypothetical protein EYF80_015558 [Liparis tanakae]
MAQEAGNPVLTATAGPQTHYSGSGFLQRGDHPLTVTSSTRERHDKYEHEHHQLDVNLCVSLSLVAPGKLASTELTGEGLLARVRADVCGQVVAPTEGAHAYSALEGFVTCVDAEVARELVRAREASVAVLRRTGVGPLVDRGFAGAVGVLPRSDGFEGESLWRRVVLRRVLLPADEPRVDLLLVFERPDGLQRGDGWRVDSDGVHGLEGLVLHHSDLPLMVEKVVVRDHGEKAAIHGGFGCGVIVIARVG